MAGGYVALFTLNSSAMHGPSPWSFLSLVVWQCGITLSPLLSPLNTGSYTKDLYMGLELFISAAHEDGRRVHNLDSVRSAHHCRWAFTEPSIRWSILQGHPGRFSLAINPVCAEFLLIGIGHASCGVHGGHPMDHDIITGTEPAPHSHAG